MLFMRFWQFHSIECQLPNHHIFLPLVSNSFCVKTYTHKSDALLLILLLYYVRWFHNFSLLFVVLCHSHSIENYSFIYSDVLNLSTHILATMAFEVCHTKDQKRLMYNFWIDIKTTFIHYGAHTHRWSNVNSNVTQTLVWASKLVWCCYSLTFYHLFFIGILFYCSLFSVSMT